MMSGISEWWGETADQEYRYYRQNIRPDLFVNPMGIHGVTHAQRVLVHCILLANYNALCTEEKDTLYTAAAYHDMGRRMDGRCLSHGLLSWRKAVKLNLLDGEDAMYRYLLRNHCIDDEDIPPLGDPTRESAAERLLMLLKDADALDRVRLGDLDARYLRNAHARHLVNYAYELMSRI